MVRAYQQVMVTCLVRPDSSVVRASGICLDGPGFNSQSGRLFCLTEGCNLIGSKRGIATAAVEESDQIGVLRRALSLPSYR